MYEYNNSINTIKYTNGYKNNFLMPKFLKLNV